MDLAARNKLIEDNIRLVGYFTGRYANKLAGKLDYDEVYSAANFGLVKAANAYEPGRGTFSTFVGLCIWSHCLMDLRAKRKEPFTLSLDAAPGWDDTENLTLRDCVPDVRADFEDSVADRDRLHRMLAVLAPAEKKLLLDYASGATQKALAQQHGLSQAHMSRKITDIRRRALAMTELRILDREEFVTRAILDLGLDVTKKKKHPERRKPMEQKTASSVAERASLYAKLREEGANPDEAAQAAGWKAFNSAQSSCYTAGIKISSKAPYLLVGAAPAPDEPAPTMAVLCVDPAPKPAIAPIEAIAPAPSALRPYGWYGKICLYTDNGDYIEIKPVAGHDFQLTRDDLRQFSEELQELLEIINT